MTDQAQAHYFGTILVIILILTGNILTGNIPILTP